MVNDSSRTVTVATRLGKSCANMVKQDVMYIAQPMPSVSCMRTADMMNTQPEGISIRNLYTCKVLHRKPTLVFVGGYQLLTYRIEKTATPIRKIPHISVIFVPSLGSYRKRGAIVGTRLCTTQIALRPHNVSKERRADHMTESRCTENDTSHKCTRILLFCLRQ